MSGTQTPQNIVSRPKVFRPPASAIAPALPKLPVVAFLLRRVMLYPPLLFGVSLLVLLAIMGVYCSITAPEPDNETQAEGYSLSSGKPVTESERLLPPVTDAVASTLDAEKEGKTFVLHSQDGEIIGQLARVPAEPEQITEIRPLSEIDKNAGHELLSIVGKY